MKTISFHIKVLKEIETADFTVRHQILELLGQLGNGVKLGMPVSRPMPSIFHGVHELRIRERSGQYRVFYYLKSEKMILVFHFFKKKTQKTSLKDIQIGRERLKELL